MRRICSSILVLFYLCSTNGVTLYQHYCMGELESVSIFQGKAGECSNCGMKKHADTRKGCCKDVMFSIEKSDNHHITSDYFNAPDISGFIIPVVFDISTDPAFIHPPVKVMLKAHEPPPLQSPLFIQYHNFRV